MTQVSGMLYIYIIFWIDSYFRKLQEWKT